MGSWFTICKDAQPINPPQEDLRSKDEKHSNAITTAASSERIQINSNPSSQVQNDLSQSKQTVQLSLTEKCQRCGNKKQGSILKFCGQILCQFRYHDACFIKHLNDQLKKEAIHFKCSCGTKLSTHFMRSCQVPEIKENCLQLLNEIFNNQVKILMKNEQKLRHEAEIQNYFKEFIQNKQQNQQDWIYVPQAQEFFKQGLLQ